jgi:predicted small secreted protein
MRRTIIISFLVALILCSAGCNAITGAQGKQSGSTGALNQSYENAVSVPTQLLIGTFKLENTSQALSAKQAADLLPLWKAYRSLSQSDSASQAELEGLTSQITETMTKEQIAAIAAMKLTSEDLSAVMQERGIALQGQGTNGSMSAEQVQTRQAESVTAGGSGQGLPGGGPDGGGPGGVPGAGVGGQALSAEQSATTQARRGTARSVSINLPLLEAFISFLQGKAQVAG